MSEVILGDFRQEFFYEYFLPFLDGKYTYKISQRGIYFVIHELEGEDGHKYTAEEVEKLAWGALRYVLAPPYLAVWHPYMRHATAGTMRKYGQYRTLEKAQFGIRPDGHLLGGYREGRVRIYQDVTEIFCGQKPAVPPEEVDTIRPWHEVMGKLEPATESQPYLVRHWAVHEFAHEWIWEGSAAGPGEAADLFCQFQLADVGIGAIYMCIQEEVNRPAAQGGDDGA